MKGKKLLAVVVLAFVGTVVAAHAEEKNEEKAEATSPVTSAAAQEELEHPFEVTGSFDLGFRAVDVSGNEDKYREDVNLRTGPRLFNLDFNINPVGSSFFDILSVQATNLGGDPFQVASVTLQNYEKFKFNYKRRKSAYFYHDIILPIEDAGNPALGLAGDFHTFNFDRINEQFGFDFNVTRQVKVFVDFNHQTRKGESTTTLDLSRDEFEMDKPLHETKDDYTVGFQAGWESFSIYFDQSYRDYENDWHIFAPGASSGEDPEDATELLYYNQLTPYDFKSPQSTFKLNFRPSRWTINFGYVYSTLESEMSYEEEFRGTAFNGNPIDSFEEGAGEINRTINMADIDVAFEATEKVSIIGGARFHRFDQEAMWEGDPGTTETGLDISTDIFELGVQTFPTPKFTVTGGLRFENRKSTAFHEGEAHEEPNTKRTTFFVNGVAALNTKTNLLVEYEKGDYDNPFTDVAPTSMDRFKLRLRAKPTEDFSIVSTYWYRKMTNSISDGKFDAQNFAARVGYDTARAKLYGSYHYQKNTNDIDTEKMTAPGFGGGQIFRFPVFYESKINMGRGGVRVPFGELFAAGLDFTAYSNKGSFPLSWNRFDVYADITSPAGYLLRVAYQRYDYKENEFDFDDYKANILLVSVGYAF